MEIVQKYSLGFHEIMSIFNTLPPSIEPTATGHICEQIEMIKEIINKDLAYEIKGNVYFDVEKYNKLFNYGQLTNRKLEELLDGTRALVGQDEKRGRLDFALWIKAKPETIMRWPSPWGQGFPGWHIECSAMSKKYLGETFDIHGGGMDLQATHHTNEIAQSQACFNKNPANYWMHTNMLTVNGVRMSKSAGNGFLPKELFTGNHPLLEKGYAPMAVKFFMLQTHYRSPLDFSNEALQASEKGFLRLMEGYSTLNYLKADTLSNENIIELQLKCYAAMNDDFNTSVLIAHLFDALKIINSANDKKTKLTQDDIDLLKTIYQDFVFDVLGLKNEKTDSKTSEALSKVMELIIDIRAKVKADKNFELSDKIRDKLTDAGIQIKDTKEGTAWKI
jgi:cysteinyl-tRNA synthetase